MKYLLIFLLLLLPEVGWCVGTTNRTHSVTLAWNASAGTSAIDHYNIYDGVVSHTYTNIISSGTNLTLTISGLASGSTYYFAATAVDTYGLESDFSAEVWWTPPTPPTPPTVLRIISGN